jgi:hypothetical protein
MTLRRLAVLQWVGLVLGGAVWFGAHVAGWGITEASCDSANFDIDHDLWQSVALATALALVLAATAAAAAVVYGTREITYEDEPPLSRMRFFAIAAVTANVIFLMIIVLDAVSSLLNIACRQA